ncbi:hypothetical protein SELMODRAFT_418051 [Selaginella moellendorffii]|uniref:Uncharacterized protein n=1 Tax=Selaginella moellendorffii TaxID=88036 RepID=D8S4H7_SELML|nr:hypothetical protein SELMODRAFT_418051 [Selaginella moellendorffii]
MPLGRKGPYFKRGADGVLFVRVDNPRSIQEISSFACGDDDAPASDSASSPPGKDYPAANSLKTEGNHFFGLKNWNKAIDLYSQCVKRCEAALARGSIAGDAENALKVEVLLPALSNRAEAFLKLEDFEHALKKDPAPKCSDFVGPVDLIAADVDDSGRGVGLFATKDVKVGELLVVSNALATGYYGTLATAAGDFTLALEKKLQLVDADEEKCWLRASYTLSYLTAAVNLELLVNSPERICSGEELLKFIETTCPGHSVMLEFMAKKGGLLDKELVMRVHRAAFGSRKCDLKGVLKIWYNQCEMIQALFVFFVFDLMLSIYFIGSSPMGLSRCGKSERGNAGGREFDDCSLQRASSGKYGEFLNAACWQEQGFAVFLLPVSQGEVELRAEESSPTTRLRKRRIRPGDARKTASDKDAPDEGGNSYAAINEAKEELKDN